MGDESIKKDRTIAKRLYTRTANSLKKAINDNSDIELITNRFKSVKEKWEILQEYHEKYIESIEDDTLIEEEDVWINDSQEEFGKN